MEIIRHRKENKEEAEIYPRKKSVTALAVLKCSSLRNSALCLCSVADRIFLHVLIEDFFRK
jgi:hypothetical protein